MQTVSSAKRAGRTSGGPQEDASGTWLREHMQRDLTGWILCPGSAGRSEPGWKNQTGGNGSWKNRLFLRFDLRPERPEGPRRSAAGPGP